MIVIPAIDLKDGCCVRLVQGDPRRETIYSKEPISMAKLWRLKGAKWLHIVDLNGAFSGKPKHLDIVKKITKEVKISVEFGGGVRTLEVIDDLIEAGVKRVILGTSAVEHISMVEKAVGRHGEKIAVALDVRRRKIATRGWKKLSAKTPMDLAMEMRKFGVKVFIYTEVARDGMLRGPDIRAISRFVAQTQTKVIASGGVSKLSDVLKLKKLDRNLKKAGHGGLIGMIVGKALYSGAIDLKEAMEAVRS